MATWRCDTFLICWEIVEPHLPSRVMRQFSMSQPIPHSVLITPDVHRRIHASKKGRTNNWFEKNGSYIDHWQTRLDHMIQGEITNEFRASADYLNWYWPRTVVHVAHPSQPHRSGFHNTSGRTELLMEGMSHIHREFQNWDPNNPISQIPQQYMGQVDATHRLLIESRHFTNEHGAFPGPPHPSVQTLRRHRSRQSRQMGDSGPPNQEGPSTYQEAGPSAYNVHEFGNYPIPDLNTASQGSDQNLSPTDQLYTFDADQMFQTLGGPIPSTYNTPTPSQQQMHQTFSIDNIFGSDCYSPQMPEEAPRDFFAGQPHEPFTLTPVPLNLGSPIFTPDSLSLSLHSTHTVPQTQTPEVEQSMPIEPQLADWNLLQFREPRHRRHPDCGTGGIRGPGGSRDHI